MVLYGIVANYGMVSMVILYRWSYGLYIISKIADTARNDFIRFTVNRTVPIIIWEKNRNIYRFRGKRYPGKFCYRLLTEILTEVPVGHSLTEFNQPFNR